MFLPWMSHSPLFRSIDASNEIGPLPGCCCYMATGRTLPASKTRLPRSISTPTSSFLGSPPSLSVQRTATTSPQKMSPFCLWSIFSVSFAPLARLLPLHHGLVPTNPHPHYMNLIQYHDRPSWHSSDTSPSTASSSRNTTRSTVPKENHRQRSLSSDPSPVASSLVSPSLQDPSCTNSDTRSPSGVAPSFPRLDCCLPHGAPSSGKCT
jgi:hypothetical protein